jgi:hypothetical protein
MSDFLDEDLEIRNQKFCVLSYTLPPLSDGKGKQRAGFDTPMVKIRGSYSTVEECESRIEVLKKTDPYFHMFVANVGLWGPLLTDKQHEEAGTNAIFMNKDMNEFMKGYKESQDKKAEEFEARKEELVKKARFDGSPEGQALLANKRENPVSVRDRMESAEKAIKDYKEKLAEMQEMYDKAKELYATYTEEEINEAEVLIKTEQLKIKNM